MQYVLHMSNTHSLNLRDIGQDRKAALQAEAKARGVSISDMVRLWIDEGLHRAEAERTRAAWIKAAAQSTADEAARLEQSGPTLARFRHPRGA